MRISTLLRHCREGFKNIIRNGWMSFASISSIFFSLFLLGVFVLLALNIDSMASNIESQVQIRVYLQTDIDQQKANELENKIRKLSDVSKVEFVSKEEGLELLRKNLGKDGDALLDGYDKDSNPLPDSFTVEVFDPQNIGVTADEISALNNADKTKPITSVKYGQGTVEKMFKITNAIRNIGLVIVIGLGITAMFLISTTIKMTILARRREIGIMKLVGATNSFIRWPFFVEGALIGIVASGITTIVVLLAYSKLVNMNEMELGLLMIKLIPVEDLGWKITVLLMGLGTLIGVWGSTLSVRKYLKV
ncbi:MULTISPECIES: permease-like cell division protein FtsX [unclassified Paenibacillus]|uniref:permease-like cell division protein FtsX n=1 Tax=unclassified Paenibacillus TaxID=185978 RepID=UPI00104F4848|nr:MULTISPECIES: permease-like cell division protein FtsX [unclassified Paenibacillus]NIK70988.1 cell division transport system permease protein [Paenibacillus sp. BK720]TCM97289.1 cell division transport system permease protein [Paenibacillus sp. BK033]